MNGLSRSSVYDFLLSFCFTLPLPFLHAIQNIQVLATEPRLSSSHSQAYETQGQVGVAWTWLGVEHSVEKRL
jgi:hypothetical protein